MTQTEIAAMVASISPIAATQSSPVDRLTPRLREVLDLIVESKSNRAIGEVLFLRERTVDSHVVRLFRALGVQSRTEAIALARASERVGDRASR